jgi:3-phenylpropionate/trans-cinnamate dioxygenase ferredoxin reductase component
VSSRDLRRIVVAGGGLAGARTCEQLRRQGFEGELVLLCAEAHAPYDRPPLSKEVLQGKRDRTTLPVDLSGLGVWVAPQTSATGLDMERRVVHTLTTETVAALPAESSGQFGFDGLVIATGSSPMTLPGGGEQFTVRTVDDAHRLRERLQPGARVVIIGASWIGAEVATSALARGCEVTCLEAGSAPVARALGQEIGKRLATWWKDVDLRLDTPVDRVETGAVILRDGTALPADVVVVGVGVRPETGWLARSGLGLDRGVVVDEYLLAAPDVVAVGDVAAWWSRRYGTRMRVEHWDDAATGPAVASASLLAADTVDSGSRPVHDPIPYFWSDQFGHKLQYVGQHDPSAPPILREPADGKGWTAAWLDGAGRLVAALTVDRPRDLLQARRALAAGSVPDPERLADPSISLSGLL